MQKMHIPAWMKLIVVIMEHSHEENSVTDLLRDNIKITWGHALSLITDFKERGWVTCTKGTIRDARAIRTRITPEGRLIGENCKLLIERSR
jgi:hypothetical protein